MNSDITYFKNRQNKMFQELLDKHPEIKMYDTKRSDDWMVHLTFNELSKYTELDDWLQSLSRGPPIDTTSSTFIYDPYRRWEPPLLKEPTTDHTDTLQEYREDASAERFLAHSAWEVRSYGFVVSNEYVWKKRFIEEGLTRPKPVPVVNTNTER